MPEFFAGTGSFISRVSSRAVHNHDDPFHEGIAADAASAPNGMRSVSVAYKSTANLALPAVKVKGNLTTHRTVRKGRIKMTSSPETLVIAAFTMIALLSALSASMVMRYRKTHRDQIEPRAEQAA
ncbi:hypothetical protein CGQ24_16740 [Arthrobacter sp. 7749]|nr:hypothetical protein CGQ24_16740 [Arthrobacter sp. 7749]